MAIVWGILRFIIGAVFGFGAALALVPAIAAIAGSQNTALSTALIFGITLVGALLALFAPSMRRAFGRSFLLLGLSVLALPLSVMMISGKVASGMLDNAAAGEQGATAVGAGIGATLMTGVAGVVGFFLGGILIIVGLVLALGGRREVVVVERGMRA